VEVIVDIDGKLIEESFPLSAALVSYPLVAEADPPPPTVTEPLPVDVRDVVLV
jgi:hypothetical protein